MTALGVAFLVVGVALVCGGLILRPAAPETNDEKSEEERDDGDERQMPER
ncbi:hypothetical protein [Bradyrhizobium sp. NP1]|nr:hypothetical protein [Bradyrhizobium sp. NP1]WJR77429.1 hypothetical protein QOU61_32665 [Bradyrhizobium sp. NP1]